MSLWIRAAWVLAVLSGPAAAQNYPSRPITLVVPFVAGGYADLTARLLATELESRLQQPVVVSNRAGAGGSVGTAMVARAPADGYTLLVALPSHLVVPEADRLQGRPPAYETSQFTPIARLSMDPVVLIGGPALARKSLPELIDEARAHPGAMTYASSGYFANTHLSMQLFQDASKTSITHIPYQGAGPAIAAVLGNQVTLSTAGPASIVPFLKSDRMKVYAVMARERITSLPEVPTLRELGVDASYYVWSVLFAPANTPPEIVTALRRATAAVAGSPSFLAAMERAGAPPAHLDGPELDKFLGAETRVLTKVVQSIGKSPDYKP